MKMEVEREALQAFTRLAKRVPEVLKQLKEGDTVTPYWMGRFRELMERSSEAEAATDAANTFDPADFEPQNGLAAVVRVGNRRNVWEVVGIANNWPRDHHPLKPGDLVVLNRTFFTYGQESAPGTLHWIGPKEINAIKRKP